MLWLILCIIVALLWSISSFIDNYQTDVVFRKRRPQSMKIFDGCTYLITAIFIFFFLGVNAIAARDIALLVFSGALSAVGSIPYFLALRDEEATSATVFYQLIPIIFLVVDWAVFNETISPLQMMGFIIILLAPIVIIFSRKRRQSRRLEYTAALFLLLYVLIYSVSGLISTHVGENYDYLSVFFWFLIGRGVTDIFMFLCNKKWQQRMKYILARRRFQYLVPAIINQTITVVAEFLDRYVLIIGIASLVAVLANILQLIFTFVLGIILSIIWPKFGREKLNRHIVTAHLIATILAIIGIILIQ